MIEPAVFPAADCFTQTPPEAPADFFEQAERIAALLHSRSQTQEQLSQSLGVSQSYIANKLRLLRFTAQERSAILTSGLTERHARALLRIPDEPEGERIRIAAIMAERRMNVAQSEEYVEELLRSQSRAEELRSRPPESRTRQLIRDLHGFCCAIDRAVDGIRKCGIAVESTRTETDDGITEIRIRLPKAI